MEIWIKTSLILCVFGFLKEFRPSEPYITHYLVGHWKNFTDEEVNQEIYPVSTYSYLAVLVVVFLVTDLLRYKSVIVFEGVSGIVSWSFLIWGTSIPDMQAMGFFFGVFSATEVAYFTYIYAQVDTDHYQKVTSYTRTAYLMGQCTSSVVAQSLVSTGTMDYYQLNFLTLGAIGLATLWACFLPSARRSIYFHHEDNNNKCIENQDDTPETVCNDKLLTSETQQPTRFSKKVQAYQFLWRDFKDAFTNMYVLKWSIWWALATCGYLQATYYVQLLWEQILKENGESSYELWNGGIDALYTIIGAAAALACGWLHVNWERMGEATLALGSLLEGAVLIISATSRSIWLAYLCYVILGVVYNTIITVANSEVAKHIREDSYCLIFGVNTFFALCLQTFLTAVVVSSSGLALPPRQQNMVYGGYFVVLGVMFIFMSIFTLCCKRRSVSSPL